jgi:hypothetical protein
MRWKATRLLVDRPWLEDARFASFEFPDRGPDKWQIVHDWLVGSGRIR